MFLALIGYRGSGKTAVAQGVALRLGWECVDADTEIEVRAGKTIAAIFSDEGEPAFRNLETNVLGELVRRDRTVMSLGGGVVLREKNRLLLRSACGPGRSRIVWLKATAQTLHERISADASTSARRPNLTPVGGLSEVRELLALREPLYRQCADLEIDTEGATIEAVTGQIVEMVQQAPAAPGRARG